MKNGIIFEIAVKGMELINLQAYGIRGSRPIEHYWRVRWIEDGEEVDQDCQFDDLATMERLARRAGEPVAWRYYETDVFADEDERGRFLEAHGVADELMAIAPIFGEPLRA